MTKQDVSHKNTKKEILEAYQEILKEAKSGSGPTPSVSSKLTKQQTQLGDLQTSLHRQADELRNTLVTASDEILDRLKQTTEGLQQAIQAQTLIQESYKLEEQKLKKEHQAQQEEFEYEFAKKKRRAQDELAESIAAKERQLEAREEKLKEQEDELADLRNQAKTFEARVQKAANDAESETEAKLKSIHSQELALIKQQSESTEKLLQQKIELMQQTVTAQQKETDRLQKEVSTANQQVTRIAERAVEKPAYQSVQQKE